MPSVRGAARGVRKLLLNQLKSYILFSVGVAVGEWIRHHGMKLLHRHKRQEGEQRSSSLKEPGRTFAVVTTAALPWRTGTSMNPMLRAAHLAADPTRKVLLVVPWVEPEQQALIFPPGVTFETREQQAEFILKEARQRTSLTHPFQVVFYAGKYFPSFGSIFPAEDIIAVIPQHERDVAILEEPEHLNWFNHSTRWSHAFPHVVGIMHTNYLAYVKEGQATGFLNAAAVYRVNRWMCRIHCDKVVKLSDAVQKLPHQVTCNVHGVAGVFLDIGRSKAHKPPAGQHRFSKGAYFIGKAIWGKGYRELINLGAEYEQAKPDPLVLDVIGSGEDLSAIQEYAASKALTWNWLGGKDHADPSMHDYQVFINPSTSDVVATTTAEALAMGKWVVVPDIACNAFFKQFRNCLTYKDGSGFIAAVDRALQKEPAPLSDSELRKLTWEAATERLLEVGSLSADEAPSAAEQRYTAALWRMWRSIVGFTALREALGMTSTTGLDEPELSESDTEEEQQQQKQQQQTPAAAAVTPTAAAPAGAAGAGPSLPPRRSQQQQQQQGASAASSGQSSAAAAAAAKAARAQAVQAELLQARSMGAPAGADWDEDWVTEPTGEALTSKSEPVL